MSSQTHHKTDYQKVKDFTEEAYETPCPATPQLMTRQEVKHTVQMVMSELSELVNTVTQSKEETEAFMEDCLHVDPSKHTDDRREVNLIAEQLDAMVDAYYYMLNACCKKGMNFSQVFEVVHKANMAKRDPKTGKFIHRETDGKVMKPEGWQAPDIVAEIRKMGYNHKE